MNTPLIDEHAARAAGCCGICGEAVRYGRKTCRRCDRLLEIARREIPDETIEAIRRRVRELRCHN